MSQASIFHICTKRICQVLFLLLYGSLKQLSTQLYKIWIKGITKKGFIYEPLLIGEAGVVEDEAAPLGVNDFDAGGPTSMGRGTLRLATTFVSLSI